jgi:7,8-dihydropterin-6-yl-methyl-4-(beta-D-ribofuranosyl)aminobenzene 5'-phosphate synthase
MTPVDTLEITVLVDNTTDSLSSNPDFVETEFAWLRRHGMKWLSGKCLCCAAHGLSCLVTARIGGASHSLLFDTGPDEWVFERNVTRLGVSLGEVGAMVLSHGHWDHGGAMPRALQMITQQSTKGKNGGKNVPVYMHPQMFGLRALRMKDGSFFIQEKVPGVDVLRGNGGDVVVTRDEQSVLGDAFHISGEIPRVTPFERGLPGQHRQKEDGTWERTRSCPTSASSRSISPARARWSSPPAPMPA